jgi:hypothetical protein
LQRPVFRPAATDWATTLNPTDHQQNPANGGDDALDREQVADKDEVLGYCGLRFGGAAAPEPTNPPAPSNLSHGLGYGGRNARAASTQHLRTPNNRRRA